MKNTNVFLSAILIVAICFSLIACNQSVNLETAADAIEYVENYVEENDKWKDVAYELNWHYSSSSSTEFHSSSYAKMEDGEWTVVLHGSISSHDFSYMACVTPDGQVTEIGIIGGFATNVHKS